MSVRNAVILRIILSVMFLIGTCRHGLILAAEVVDKVLVIINDEVVTQREFNRTFSAVKNALEQKFTGEELELQLTTAREEILEQLVNSKLVISLAKSKKIEIAETELKNRLDKIQSFYKDKDAFLQALAARGTTLTEFEKEIREQMLAQELVEQEVASKIVISPAEIKALYEKNKEQLLAPPTVKVRTIMLRKAGNAEADHAKKDLMENLVKQIKSGESFGDLAFKYSEGPFTQKHGEMGYISPGQTIKEIDEVLFSMENGALSEIIETNVGYHLFLIEDKKDAQILELKDVNDFLREQLHLRKFEESLTKWLESKRSEAYISYK